MALDIDQLTVMMSVSLMIQNMNISGFDCQSSILGPGFWVWFICWRKFLIIMIIAHSNPSKWNPPNWTKFKLLCIVHDKNHLVQACMRSILPSSSVDMYNYLSLSLLQSMGQLNLTICAEILRIVIPMSISPFTESCQRVWVRGSSFGVSLNGR